MSSVIKITAAELEQLVHAGIMAGRVGPTEGTRQWMEGYLSGQPHLVGILKTYHLLKDEM